jgi:Icc protein
MLIAQITDLHVHARGEPVSALVDANENLAIAIDFLNTLVPRPDVVVATGDLTDNGTPEQYSALRELLERLELPLYLVPGNHDERVPLAEAFPLHAYLPRDGAPQSYAVDDHPVRLVGIDTTHPGHHDGELTADELAWLDATLAARPDAPTLVFMHHPPFDTGVWWMDCVGLSAEHRRGFEDVIRRHPQVQRVVAGHIHRPVQTTWGAAIVSVSPSTAHQVGLDLVAGGGMRLTDEPPMVTLLDWTDERVLNHLASFMPTASLDIGEDMPDGAKTAILERPPAVKGGAFN